MSVRYDPLLAGRLAAEIGVRWSGATARDVWFDSDARLVELRFRGVPSLVLWLHPEAGYVLPVERSLERGRRIGLRGLRLGAVTSPADHRGLAIRIGPADSRGRLLEVDLRTNRRNAVLRAVPDGPVLLALRPGSGHPAEEARRFADVPMSREAWIQLFAGIAPEERGAAALREIAFLSRLNVDFVLGDAGTGTGVGDEEKALGAAWERYSGLREGGTGAWTLSRSWGRQPYPHALGDAEARPASSLLEAMREAAEAAEVLPIEDGETARLRGALASRLRRIQKRRASLERQLGGAADPDALRRAGSLLLARRAEVPRGRSRITLEDFEGRPVEIQLDPACDAVGNAERLFAEARSRERASRRLPALIRAAAAEAASVSEALAGLTASGPSDALWLLAGGRPAESGGEGRGDRPATLPYRRLRSTGGLEIRVGRGAASNDDLTFRHADPEDIWLHAEGSPGAHVILRWGRRDQNPPRADLVEAAVVAAVNSAARGSGTVAVSWTRRKHVRKPRKAPPGTVRLERARTLFVAPDRGLVDRLSEG